MGDVQNGFNSSYGGEMNEEIIRKLKELCQESYNDGLRDGLMSFRDALIESNNDNPVILILLSEALKIVEER